MKMTDYRKFSLLALCLLAFLFLTAIFSFTLKLAFADTVTAIFITCSCALLLALVFFLFWREALTDNHIMLILIALPFCILILVRISFFDHITDDYTIFLARWIQHFKENGGFLALDRQVGNYNIPYVVILAFFSYLPIHDLYLIKLLSVFFDVLLAFSLLKIVSLYTTSELKQIVSFLLALLLPTPLLNGAYWGQCDTIYAAFTFAAFYFAISERPLYSVISIAIAFSFKLQAIFFLPIYALFMLSGKLKVRHLAAFPITYFFMILPAVFAGRPLLDSLTVYTSELASVGSGLNYNSPSVYSLFYDITDTGLAANLGVLAAVSLCAVIIFCALIRKSAINDTTLLCAAFIFCLGIPLFLPHMHDRYFFLADVFALLFAVLFPKFIPLTILVSFASLLGYHAYLKRTYLLTMNYGFWALAIVIIALIAFYLYHLFFETSSPSHGNETILENGNE